jgi:hypothetical protein
MSSIVVFTESEVIVDVAMLELTLEGSLDEGIEQVVRFLEHGLLMLFKAVEAVPEKQEFSLQL